MYDLQILRHDFLSAFSRDLPGCLPMARERQQGDRQTNRQTDPVKASKGSNGIVAITVSSIVSPLAEGSLSFVLQI